MSLDQRNQPLFGRQSCTATVVLFRSFGEGNIALNFYYLRTVNNFYMTIPFMYNFRSFFNKFPTIS